MITQRAQKSEKWGPAQIANRKSQFANPDVHPSESAGAAVIPQPLPAPSLSALLRAHVLRDGETIILALKPSLWLILFQSIAFCAVVLLAYLATRVFADRTPPVYRVLSFNAAVLLIAGRLVWATLVWIGRLYVLTDQRVIRLTGVFHIDIRDCPLRKIESAEITYNVRERLCAVGSIEIQSKPNDDCCPPHIWQTVARPLDVHKELLAAIRRANCS